MSLRTLGMDTRAVGYGDSGAPTIVLVHGFRGDHHGLEGIAAELASSMRVRAVVPDLPGFGETPPVPGREHDIACYASWLIAFVDALAQETGSRPIAVLGHSFGSIVVAAAIEAGLQTPRLILINPISTPALEGPQAALTRLTEFYYLLADRLPERASRALLGHPTIVRAMSEVMAKTRDRGLRAWIHEQHAAYFSRFADSRTLLQAYRASVSHTVSEFVPAIRSLDAPTLILAGERDDLSSPDAQLSLSRRIPGSRLEIFPGVGHLVHYEAVAETGAAIAAFLAGSGEGPA